MDFSVVYWLCGKIIEDGHRNEESVQTDFAWFELMHFESEWIWWNNYCLTIGRLRYFKYYTPCTWFWTGFFPKLIIAAILQDLFPRIYHYWCVAFQSVKCSSVSHSCITSDWRTHAQATFKIKGKQKTAEIKHNSNNIFISTAKLWLKTANGTTSEGEQSSVWVVYLMKRHLFFDHFHSMIFLFHRY